MTCGPPGSQPHQKKVPMKNLVDILCLGGPPNPVKERKKVAALNQEGDRVLGRTKDDRGSDKRRNSKKGKGGGGGLFGGKEKEQLDGIIREGGRKGKNGKH